MRYVVSTLISCFLLNSSFAIAAEMTPEEKGLKIAKDMEKANNGFKGESGSMVMTLIDAHGTRTERLMEGQSLEVAEDGDKSLSTFNSPADVKGTKMLTHSHKKDDDDQWLYLPSLRRVKRISGSNKSASFMGSEFSYEDLGSQEVEKYSFKFLKDAKIEGQDVWMLERVPTFKSGYSKQVVAVSKKYMNAIKIDYFDRKGELLKKASFDDWKQYTVDGKKLWRSNKIHMKNVQTLKESLFVWNERKVGVTFNDSEFSKRRLQ